ncbi:MAG: CGNR zinc finger domain-containing protein [Actinomycetota bacterium]|nr:CGNR zinc finger domain-containing protein [Actinomycetota bacterium]
MHQSRGITPVWDARADLDPLTARRFRSGRACIDFTHTGGVGAWQATELVHDAATASRWLALCLEVQKVRARESDIEPLRQLREAIWQLAQAAVHDRPLLPRHIRTVNSFASLPAVIRLLTADPTIQIRIPTGQEALATLARDAVEVFGGPLAGRVRECAASDCQLLLVDNSVRGQRRWCSMERCGNRAKVRNHRSRGR